jgi:hypothetical protein
MKTKFEARNTSSSDWDLNSKHRKRNTRHLRPRRVPKNFPRARCSSFPVLCRTTIKVSDTVKSQLPKMTQPVLADSTFRVSIMIQALISLGLCQPADLTKTPINLLEIAAEVSSGAAWACKTRVRDLQPAVHQPKERKVSTQVTGSLTWWHPEWLKIL